MDGFTKMMDFINRLESKNIWYRLAHNRVDALNVEVYVPGAHWEVEFFPDGTVEIEIFQSDGTIHNEQKLEELFGDN